MGKRFFKEALMRPVMRGSFTIIVAVSWFIFAGFLFLQILPSFAYYETMIGNQGTTDNDVYYLWSWGPTLWILIGGIFWSSGLLGRLGKVVSRL